MSLPHAILTLLQNEKASGYDLTRHFAQSADHVWSTTHQQIYLELGKLHRAGKVDFDVIRQSGKPDKKLYRITPAGNEALHKWLQRPASGKRVRESLLIKILASHLISTESLLAELRLHRAENEQALSHYQILQAALGVDQDNMSRADKSTYLSLRRGIIDRQAWLQWANEAEALLGETESADHA